jgi:AraC family transcriptional regulator
MQPQIVSKPAFTVVGLRIHTKPLTPEIPQLWDQFVPRMAEITQVAEPNVSYGVMESNAAMTELVYMAGNPVTGVAELPTGMSRWDLPANTYAVFPATLHTIGETFGYIFNTWLPTANHQLAAGPYFERYPETFGPDNDALAIYIPVTKKAESQ